MDSPTGANSQMAVTAPIHTAAPSTTARVTRSGQYVIAHSIVTARKPFGDPFGQSTRATKAAGPLPRVAERKEMKARGGCVP